MTRPIALLLAFVALLATGCQNPYSKFYTNVITPEHQRWLLPHIGETQVIGTSRADSAGTVDSLVQQGYVVIGFASFEADARGYESALDDKAKEVEADVVVRTSSGAGTRTGVVPITTYKPGQTYTTYESGQIHANAYGSRGYGYGTANYAGTATTTSSGTYDTQLIPYSVQRGSYGAVFLRKYHYLFGARFKPLSDEQKQILQRNAGLNVVMVIDGTPAFSANILPGDVLITMDGQMITSGDMLNQFSLEKAGQTVRIGLIRKGAEKIVDVRLSPANPA